MRSAAADAKYSAITLIELGADICVRTGLNETALHFAAIFNSFEVTSIIIQQFPRNCESADIRSIKDLLDLQNSAGRTPLQIAISLSNRKMADILGKYIIIIIITIPLNVMYSIF